MDVVTCTFGVFIKYLMESEERLNALLLKFVSVILHYYMLQIHSKHFDVVYTLYMFYLHRWYWLGPGRAAALSCWPWEAPWWSGSPRPPRDSPPNPGPAGPSAPAAAQGSTWSAPPVSVTLTHNTESLLYSQLVCKCATLCKWVCKGREVLIIIIIIQWLLFVFKMFPLMLILRTSVFTLQSHISVEGWLAGAESWGCRGHKGPVLPSSLKRNAPPTPQLPPRLTTLVKLLWSMLWRKRAHGGGKEARKETDRPGERLLLC